MVVSRRTRTAFSLIELVIVVVIIGIIGAIAIPRMSRGAAGAADNSLRQNLAILRSAVELFATEHNGAYPGASTIAAQLTSKTDATGAVGTGATHIYGPYLKAIPPLPVGARKGGTDIAAADAAGVGWIFTASSGDIKANCTDSEKDVADVKYNTY